MPETLAIQSARSAATAIRALDDLDRHDLAENPAELYILLDHLATAVSPLLRISFRLGALLDDWADQRGLLRSTGPSVSALHIAADHLAGAATTHAARLYGALDAAQHVLDPGDYRSRYGLGVSPDARRNTDSGAR